MNASLVYGHVEIGTDSAIKSVYGLDSAIDGLGISLNQNNAIVENANVVMTQSASATDLLKQSFDNFTGSLGGLAILGIIIKLFFDLIKNSKSFQKIIELLTNAFQPLVQAFEMLGEFIANVLLSFLRPFIMALKNLILFFTKTEIGLNLLKVGLIFFASILAIVLLPVIKTLLISIGLLIKAFIVMAIPLLPFIAIALAVASAITTVILILEDLYYFATGQGGSVAGEFFAMVGLSKEEIESIRKTIKNFIDTVKNLWNSFTKNLTNIVPIMRKAFAGVFNIAKSFFVGLFGQIKAMIEIFSGVFKVIKGIFTGDFNLILDGFKKIGSGIIDLFSNVFSTIKNIFSGVVDLIKPLAGVISSLFGGGSSPVKIDGARAEGGSIEAGKNYLVGEKGAEIISTKSNGNVIPNDKISSGGGSSKAQSKSPINNTININVNASISSEKDSEQIISKLKEALNKLAVEFGQELGVAL